MSSSLIILETFLCDCFNLISALLHMSEQNLISTSDEISLRPYKMAFVFPSLSETFHLIYPRDCLLFTALHPTSFSYPLTN